MGGAAQSLSKTMIGTIGKTESEATRARRVTFSLSGFKVTPGFGFRMKSMLGPIRFDVGINPGAEQNSAVGAGGSALVGDAGALG